MNFVNIFIYTFFILFLIKQKIIYFRDRSMIFFTPHFSWWSIILSTTYVFLTFTRKMYVYFFSFMFLDLVLKLRIVTWLVIF